MQSLNFHCSCLLVIKEFIYIKIDFHLNQKDPVRKNIKTYKKNMWNKSLACTKNI